MIRGCLFRPVACCRRLSVVSCLFWSFGTVGSPNLRHLSLKASKTQPLSLPDPPPPLSPLNMFSPCGPPLQTLFSFEADATALVPDVFSLGFEDEYEELEADLQEFSEKFADSPAAQVCARVFGVCRLRFRFHFCFFFLSRVCMYLFVPALSCRSRVAWSCFTLLFFLVFAA